MIPIIDILEIANISVFYRYNGGKSQKADIWPKPITDSRYFIGLDFYRYRYFKKCRYIGRPICHPCHTPTCTFSRGLKLILSPGCIWHPSTMLSSLFFFLIIFDRISWEGEGHPILGWRHSFPSHNYILIPPSNLNFIVESWSETSFYPNPEHKFEFYQFLTRVYFILSQKF